MHSTLTWRLQPLLALTDKAVSIGGLQHVQSQRRASGEAVCIAFNHLTVICSSQQSRSDIYPQLWPSEIDERIPTRLLQDPISSKPFQPSAQIPFTSVEGTDNTPPTQRHTWSCHMAAGMRSPASSGCPALPWEPGVPLAGEA